MEITPDKINGTPEEISQLLKSNNTTLEQYFGKKKQVDFSDRCIVGVFIAFAVLLIIFCYIDKASLASVFSLIALIVGFVGVFLLYLKYEKWSFVVLGGITVILLTSFAFGYRSLEKYAGYTDQFIENKINSGN